MEISERQKKVIELIASGMNNAEISANLFLAPGTVQAHITNLRNKFTAKNKAQIVAVALRKGLIE